MTSAERGPALGIRRLQDLLHRSHWSGQSQRCAVGEARLLSAQARGRPLVPPTHGLEAEFDHEVDTCLSASPWQCCSTIVNRWGLVAAAHLHLASKCGYQAC